MAEVEVLMRRPITVLLASLSMTAPLVLADPALAKEIRLPIVRDARGVPVPCVDDPSCHNRFHPAIPAVARANPGDVVVFETRDAFDNQLNAHSTRADVAALDASRVHPLTGPVHVNGAGPGDVLEVEVLKVEPGPDRFGYTIVFPGFGFLRDRFTEPAIARWSLTPGHAVAPELPGIRVPSQGFPGTIGVSPDRGLLTAVLIREAELAAAGGFVLLPDPTNAAPRAVCQASPAAVECLRTIPPRENGGNMDVKGMVAGTRLLFPCLVPGCNLSIGDVHFAQGDGEVSGTAIEMNAVITVRVKVRKGQAFLLNNRPAFEGGAQFKQLAPSKFYSTIGYPLKPRAEVPPTHTAHFDIPEITRLENLSEDLTLAARDALFKMIEYLQEAKRLTAEQAYLLSSVAVDLRIGNLVDVPNFAVYGVLSLDVFHGEREGHEGHD
jgi:formamidase